MRNAPDNGTAIMEKKKGINVNLSINEEFFREIDFQFLSFIKSPTNEKYAI